MFAGELSGLSKQELERELAEQAARVDAGLCRLLELVAECEQRLDYAAGDGVTFAGWLAWRCSLLPRQARAHERIGRRLAGLPLIHAAFARGELSYAKVGVLVSVAAPATEAALLELAEVMTASQLARCLAAYRRVSSAEAVVAQEREFLDCFWSDEGWLELRGRLAADEGALFLQALEAAREALWQRRRTNQPEPAEDEAPTEPLGPFADSVRVTNAEALAALADLALAQPGADRSGGERYQLVVHADQQTLSADRPGRCQLTDGPPLAPETARRLACDASLVELTEHDHTPLKLGRKRRTIPPALRRALQARDHGCRYPGCDRNRLLDAHHIQHSTSGGHTNLDNLLLLCRRHHRLLHEHRYTLSLDPDGHTHFHNQHGITIPNQPPRPPPSGPDGLHHQQHQHGLTIDDDTCKNGHGDPM
jgi:hypothetical protein